MKTKYHFIGIGGIGMSALARILLQKGCKVQGSDRSSNYITEALLASGATIFQDHQESHLQDSEIVVYSTGIPEENPELLAAKKRNLPLLHRAELLAELMKGSQAIAVTGTHGKTTTSSLIAHLLTSANLSPSYAIGGVVANLDANGGMGNSSWFVAEADESDGSFLKLPKKYAIVTNLENDHLSHWGSMENLRRGFSQFCQEIDPDGAVLFCLDDSELKGLDLKGISYGFDPSAEAQILSWHQTSDGIAFDLKFDGKLYSKIFLPIFGRHNVQNGAAVFTLALLLGMEEGEIRSAFETFQGVHRRMEKKGERQGVVFYDDYAHHPTEIKTTLTAFKKRAQEHRVVAIFQPHRFSRTADCWDEFLKAFSAADILIVTDVYTAGETPLEGISGKALLEALKGSFKKPAFYVPKKELISSTLELLRPFDWVITLGAGDITKLSGELLKEKIPLLKMAMIRGGASTEHEVSLLSAKVIESCFDAEMYQRIDLFIAKDGSWEEQGKKIGYARVCEVLQGCDVVFPIVHGSFCEDGSLQGFLETIGVAFAGPDSKSGALAMDKGWSKRIAMSAGIATAPFVEIDRTNWKHNWVYEIENIKEMLSFPVFVKPAHLGSTMGVSRVETEEELRGAIDCVMTLDYKAIVEKEVHGREMEIGLFGCDPVVVSNPAEVVKEGSIYTYEGKYDPRRSLPAKICVELPAAVKEEGMAIARTIYDLVGCKSLARIDFFLTDEYQWIFNEINPIPGMTPTSVYPKLWPQEGLSLGDVLSRIVRAALYRKRERDETLLKPC